MQYLAINIFNITEAMVGVFIISIVFVAAWWLAEYFGQERK